MTVDGYMSPESNVDPNQAQHQTLTNPNTISNFVYTDGLNPTITFNASFVSSVNSTYPMY